MILLKLFVVTLTAVVGWLLAALQYRPNWKDGRTTRFRRARDFLFFLLPCILLASLTLTYWDHCSTQKAQDMLGSFIQRQQDSDIPNLVALTVIKEKNDYILRVKNIGTKTATQVKVIFSKDSIPSVFSGNTISGTKEIPNSTEYSFTLNLFSGIIRTMSTTNSEPGYKESLEASLQLFKNGSMAFIPRFYLEYYDNEKKKYISSTYYLILESQRGLVCFNKE